MKRWWPLLLVGGLLLLAGSSAAEAGAGNAPGGRKARILNRYVADGVHPAMQWLLDQWENEGWFDVQIGTPFSLGNGQMAPGGALRTDDGAQAAAAGAGLSQASTLATTPHGRGAALDIWPAGYNPNADFSTQPEMAGLMAQFGQWAAQKKSPWCGYQWGGLWSPPAGPDYPHVQMDNWRSLPFPPPDYTQVYA